MKRGEPRQLEITSRYGQISAQHSIQDLYDLLVELITNSDDSYRYLYEQGQGDTDRGPILIEVDPRRGDRRSEVTVADRAAGIGDLDKAIARVGDRTSHTGDRGFMARGLKDCAALGEITVDTIRDGRHKKAEITSDFRYVPYDHARPSKALRHELGIPQTGTRVHVELKNVVRVPQKHTLIRELPWHFALRDIFTAGKVRLRVGDDKPEAVPFLPPSAEIVHDEEFEVHGYPGVRARFTLYRTDKPLEDPADKRFRRTGILISGSRATHACSFLTPELDRDPMSDRYFGRLQTDGIDQLAREWDDRREAGEEHPDDNPILIFDPNRRTGLQLNHPFTQALYEIPIEVLKLQFDKERAERKQQQSRIEAKETTDRLRKLAKEASKFLRDKLEDIDAVSSTDVVNEKSFHEKGVTLVPSYTQIPEGKEKRFYARVDGRLGLPNGTSMAITLSKAARDAVELVGKPTDLEPDIRHEGIQRASFTLRGKRQSKRAQIGCKVDDLDEVYAEVEVVPTGPRDLEIPGDFAFHRSTYTVRRGARRTLKLRARFNPPPEQPPSVSFRLDDPDAVVLRRNGALELTPGTTYYEAELVVEGRQLNAETKVFAESNGKRAEANIAVVAKDEEGVELQFELVEHSLGQSWRALWDRKEPNKLLITTQHQSVSRYLGKRDEGYPGQHDPPFRVLLAELIADNVCRRIVEEHMRVLPGELNAYGIYLEHSKLMKEFTPIAHRIMLANPGGTS